MTELELLQLADGGSQAITEYFAQIIAITFAMIIGVYYFLNEARIGIKIFAYAVYLIGIVFYFGVMLSASSMNIAVRQALAAIPPDQQSVPTQTFLAVSDSWIVILTSATLNIAIWVLTLGVGWLLFFWKKHRSTPASE